MIRSSSISRPVIPKNRRHFTAIDQNSFTQPRSCLTLSIETFGSASVVEEAGMRAMTSVATIHRPFESVGPSAAGRATASAPHRALGLSDAAAVELYRTMLVARLLSEQC